MNIYITHVVLPVLFIAQICFNTGAKWSVRHVSQIHKQHKRHEGEDSRWVIGGVAIGNRDMTGFTNQWLWET